MIGFPKTSTTIEYCRTTFAQTWRDFVARKKRLAVAEQQQPSGAGEPNLARKNPQSMPLVEWIGDSPWKANVKSETPLEPKIS
jgi:hypothetical protein